MADVRYEYEADLVLVSPLHLGGGAGDDVDALVARDAAGRIVVPGTALAGALRDLDRRLDPVDDPEHGERWGSIGRASAVTVDDALLELGGRALDVRAGIAIDRGTSTSASGFLHEREVVPPGATLTFRLTVDEVATSAVERLFAAVAADGLVLGAGSVRGLGRLELPVASAEPVRRRRIDLGDPGALAALLAVEGADSSGWKWDRVEIEPRTSPGRLEVSVDWSPATPMLSRGPRATSGVDSVPVTSSAAGDEAGVVRPILQGSSIRGVLRTHAEAILRTVLEIAPSSAPTARDRLTEDQDLPLIDRLFGEVALAEHARRRAPGSRSAAGTDLRRGRRGALRIHDCVARSSLPVAALDGLETGGVIELHGGGRIAAATHVALDRWTGGAIPGLLFDVAEVEGVVWQPIELVVDRDLLARDRSGAAERGLADAALGLLALVLGDLALGRIPLGGLVTRGRGQVASATVAWRDHAGEVDVTPFLSAWRDWVRAERERRGLGATGGARQEAT